MSATLWTLLALVLFVGAGFALGVWLGYRRGPIVIEYVTEGRPTVRHPGQPGWLQ